jgi:hypothetical protein
VSWGRFNTSWSQRDLAPFAWRRAKVPPSFPFFVATLKRPASPRPPARRESSPLTLPAPDRLSRSDTRKLVCSGLVLCIRRYAKLLMLLIDSTGNWGHPILRAVCDSDLNCLVLVEVVAAAIPPHTITTLRARQAEQGPGRWIDTQRPIPSSTGTKSSSKSALAPRCTLIRQPPPLPVGRLRLLQPNPRLSNINNTRSSAASAGQQHLPSLLVVLAIEPPRSYPRATSNCSPPAMR